MDEVLDHSTDHDLAMCERDRTQNESTIQKQAYREGAEKGEEDGVQAGFEKRFGESCKRNTENARMDMFEALCKEFLKK